MQKIVPCLWLNNEAEEMVAFYKTVFPQVQETSRSHYTVETPSNKPVGSVMTISFTIDGFEFMALNGGEFFKPNPSISFTVNCASKEEVQQLHAKLVIGGKELMPLQEYPFSPQYSWVEDQFGISWQLILSDAIPNQRIMPALMFTGDQNGKSLQAMKKYVSLFSDSELGDVMHYAEGMEPDTTQSVMHANFKLADQWFSAMDSAHSHAFAFSEGISLAIYCKDQAEIDSWYESLSANTEAEMCGWLKDEFGISWQLVTREIDELIAGPKGKAIMEAILDMKRIDLTKLQNLNA